MTDKEEQIINKFLRKVLKSDRLMHSDSDGTVNTYIKLEDFCNHWDSANAELTALESEHS